MKKKARLIIALLCAIVQGAWAQNEEIQYIDYLWNDNSQTLNLYVSQTSDYTELKGNHEKEEVWMASSCYYVIKEADVRYKRLIAPEYGTAYLILEGDKGQVPVTLIRQTMPAESASEGIVLPVQLSWSHYESGDRGQVPVTLGSCHLKDNRYKI